MLDDGFMSKKQLRELLTLSFATIDRWVREGRLPQPTVLAWDCKGKPSRVAWRTKHIKAWIDDITDGPPTPAE
jgi:predicted DNA-binding transcriptional regulator AlpA